MDDKLLDTIFTILMRDFAKSKQDGMRILDVALEIRKEAALHYIIPLVEARVKEVDPTARAVFWDCINKRAYDETGRYLNGE